MKCLPEPVILVALRALLLRWVRRYSGVTFPTEVLIYCSMPSVHSLTSTRWPSDSRTTVLSDMRLLFIRSAVQLCRRKLMSIQDPQCAWRTSCLWVKQADSCCSLATTGEMWQSRQCWGILYSLLICCVALEWILNHTEPLFPSL